MGFLPEHTAESSECGFESRSLQLVSLSKTLNYNGRLWSARWQQTHQVNFHCLHSSEHAHITENKEFTWQVCCHLVSHNSPICFSSSRCKWVPARVESKLGTSLAAGAAYSKGVEMVSGMLGFPKAL